MKKLFEIKYARDGEVVIITYDQKPKENTNTVSQGFNGDWFWCSKWNCLGCSGDITSYDFKVIASHPRLGEIPMIKSDFVDEWLKNPVAEIEVELVATHAIDEFGRKLDYAFETTDKVIYGLKVNDYDEVICTIPNNDKLDLSLLEEKLDVALKNETEESLSEWLFISRIKDAALSNSSKVVLIEPSDRDYQMGKRDGLSMGQHLTLQRIIGFINKG